MDDLVMCYNIVFGLTCLKMSDYFIFSPVCVTRGHPYKVFVPRTVVNVLAVTLAATAGALCGAD